MSEQAGLAAFLEKLKKERANLNITIARLEAELGQESDSESDPMATEVPDPLTSTSSNGADSQLLDIRSDTFFTLSIPKASKKFLQIVKRPAETSEIATALKKGGIVSRAKHFNINVHTALHRDKKTFVRVDNKWGLAEWYPNRPKQAEATKAKKLRIKTKVSKPVKS